ncbi:MAG: zinc-dependent metalloprotease [Bacteroidales bacterium]
MNKSIISLLMLFTLSMHTVDCLAIWPFKKKVKTTTVATPKKQNDYDKLFSGKNKKTEKGMMTLHMVEDKLYVELPLNMLGRDMLLFSSVAEITDHMDCYVGHNPIRPLHVKFSKIGKSIQLRRDRNFSVSEDKLSAAQTAIEESNIPAILASYEIKAYSKDSSAVVFDMTDLFVGNESLLTAIDPRSESKLVLQGVQFTPSKEQSFLDDIRVFDDNLTVYSYMTYNGKYSTFFNKLTTARMSRSLVLLPEKEMESRLSDYRLPLNSLIKLNYHTDYKPMTPTYYATRWRLEPRDSAAYARGELVEPVKPIVFYVDTVFSDVLRNAIIDGITEWNKSFEHAGFKNAIQVKMYPKDDENFDPENFKYNCVRYVPSLSGNTSVRTTIDPRSGEIMRTTMFVCHNIVYEKPFDIFVNTAHADPAVRTRYIPDAILQEHLKNHFTWLAGTNCFGMTYNLTASAGFSTDSLRNAAFTQKYGTTPSMLDVAYYNSIAPIDAVEKGFRLTPKGVGEYDNYIVNWLYHQLPGINTETEKFKTLKKIVDSKSGCSIYRYENAKDCPDCGANDVGNDDVKAFKYGIENLRYVMNNFDKWISDKDDYDYSFRSGMYGLIYRRYKQLITQVAINAYGIKTHERKAGDPVPSYEYTPRKKQIECLDILFNELTMPDWVERREIAQNITRISERADEHNSYMDLLITATAGKLFAYEGVNGDHMGHTEYIQYMYGKLFDKTIKNQKLEEHDRFHQMNFFKSMIKSSHIIDRKYAIRKTGSASAFSLTETELNSGHDFSDPKSYYKLIDSFPLYSGVIESDVESNVIGARQYGELKYWPVMNVQVSRHIYYDILKNIKIILPSKVKTASKEDKLHYQYMIDTLNRLLD